MAMVQTVQWTVSEIPTSYKAPVPTPASVTASRGGEWIYSPSITFSVYKYSIEEWIRKESVGAYFRNMLVVIVM